jgi:hypothetical protein
MRQIEAVRSVPIIDKITKCVELEDLALALRRSIFEPQIKPCKLGGVNT